MVKNNPGMPLKIGASMLSRLQTVDAPNVDADIRAYTILLASPSDQSALVRFNHGVRRAMLRLAAVYPFPF